MSIISAVLRTYISVTHREPRYVTPLWDAAVPPGWVVCLLRRVWAPLSIHTSACLFLPLAFLGRYTFLSLCSVCMLALIFGYVVVFQYLAK